MQQIGSVVISDETWEARFDCDLQSCKGACCQYGDRGSPIDEQEETRIAEILPEILPWLSARHRHFLEAGISERYKGELHLREIAHDQPCPLGIIDPDGILWCSLHRYAMEKSLALLGTKPLWCSLFPLMIKKREEFWHINSAIQPHCRSIPHPPPLLIAFRKVLEPIFGSDWMEAVCQQYQLLGMWTPDEKPGQN